MRVLVTGGRGFVGRWLSRELLRAGHAAYAVDRDEADLANPGEAEALIGMVRPDYVAHLAARYGRLLCRDEPHRATADNAAATVEIAATCAERGTPVLYASSSEVYGDHGIGAITEASTLLMPTTIYGLSKRWGEEALALYGARRCVVRMNMLYGPWQLGGYGRCSLATFVADALAGRSFTVHEGTSRSWLYASDAVRALRLLIEGGHTGTFNLGNPEPPLAMTEVARMVKEEVNRRGKPVSYEVGPPPAGQIAHKNYDSSKLTGRIDWAPEVGLEEGIRRTVDWAGKGAESAVASHADQPVP